MIGRKEVIQYHLRRAKACFQKQRTRSNSVMNDISIEFHEEVSPSPADDLADRVSSRHPELGRPSDDGPLDRRSAGDGPAQDRHRAPVVLPLREHEVYGRQQRRAIQGGLGGEPLCPPDQLGVPLWTFPEHVVDHDERPEGVDGGVLARWDCDDESGRVRAGVHLVEVEVQVGHLLFTCIVFMAGCSGNRSIEGEGKKKKKKGQDEGRGIGHGEACVAGSQAVDGGQGGEAVYL
ncbi:hypothetical protein B296_00012199 [Ensete ventricosum]|uniref:Uncharacterized protein n=1 Tax=Ensete ventricosum TaxID=4639 RepID=A0A427ATY5_ENSVE|nr:hypothetical protein B296_00012199 [Ensete ventricosum]